MTPIAEWVNLGLPSGTLWRRMNVGATTPLESGLFFTWGNVDGYPFDTDHRFTAANYANTPGAALVNDITPQYDCARFALGSQWRMPTASEFQELIDCTEHSFESVNDIQCVVFSGGGNSLIVPLYGVISEGGPQGANERTSLWSSSYYTEAVARTLFCRRDTTEVTVSDSGSRYGGRNVRAVRMPTIDTPLTLVVEQCLGSTSRFFGQYIAFGIAGNRRYLIADWMTPTDPDDNYGCRVFSNLADISDPESAALPANQIYLTDARDTATSLNAFINYFNEDNVKPIAGVISSGSAMSLIEGLLISPTAPV